MSAPAVEVTGLVKRFGAVTAVDGVTFRIGRGETVALLGPNGSGKTTTLKCAAGLLRPDAGAIRMAGFDLGRALLERTPKPTAEQATRALDGNLCRCGTNIGLLKAALGTTGVRRG
jgi:ABC-type branched-subunit amino acid transport system ATPase component